MGGFSFSWTPWAPSQQRLCKQRPHLKQACFNGALKPSALLLPMILQADKAILEVRVSDLSTSLAGAEGRLQGERQEKWDLQVRLQRAEGERQLALERAMEGRLFGVTTTGSAAGREGGGTLDPWTPLSIQGLTDQFQGGGDISSLL